MIPKCIFVALALFLTGCSPPNSKDVRMIKDRIDKLDFRTPQDGQAVVDSLGIQDEMLIWSVRGHREACVLEGGLELVLVSQEPQFIAGSSIDHLIDYKSPKPRNPVAPQKSYVAVELYRDGKLLAERSFR